MSTSKIAHIAAVDFDFCQTFLPVIVSSTLRVKAYAPNTPPGGFFPVIAIDATIGQLPLTDLLLDSQPFVSIENVGQQILPNIALVSIERTAGTNAFVRIDHKRREWGCAKRFFGWLHHHVPSCCECDTGTLLRRSASFTWRPELESLEVITPESVTRGLLSASQCRARIERLRLPRTASRIRHPVRRSLRNVHWEVPRLMQFIKLMTGVSQEEFFFHCQLQHLVRRVRFR